MPTPIEQALICVFALFVVLTLSTFDCAISSDAMSCEVSIGTIVFLQMAISALGLILCMTARR